jgi:hypothetical protein
MIVTVQGFKVQRFRVQRRRRPKKRPVKSKKKLNGIDRPFSDRINPAFIGTGKDGQDREIRVQNNS